jgi:hypothetical protein
VVQISTICRHLPSSYPELLGIGVPLGIIPLGIIPLGIIPPGIGVPLGIGIPLGLGMSGIILSGIFMSQHMLPGFGAAGAGGLLGWGAEAVTGCTVNIPEEPAQVPAKKVATAIQAKAKTAAITRLRSRRSLLSSPKNPIGRFLSIGVRRRFHNQMTSPRAPPPVYYLAT